MIVICIVAILSSLIVLNDGRFSQRRMPILVYLTSLFPFFSSGDTNGSNSISKKDPKRQRSHSSRENVEAWEFLVTM